jgi:hypothetical protein
MDAAEHRHLFRHYDEPAGASREHGQGTGICATPQVGWLPPLRVAPRIGGRARTCWPRSAERGSSGRRDGEDRGARRRDPRPVAVSRVGLAPAPFEADTL